MPQLLPLEVTIERIPDYVSGYVTCIVSYESLILLYTSEETKVTLRPEDALLLRTLFEDRNTNINQVSSSLEKRIRSLQKENLVKVEGNYVSVTNEARRADYTFFPRLVPEMP